jgi:CDP-glycerol glycerophosphotransferase (TagB/SpsB family)
MKNTLRRLLWRRGGFHLAIAVRLAELPLRAAVRALVRRVPRDPHLIAFGSARDRFGDNTAYLYLSLAAHSSPNRCVWITGSASLVDRLRGAGLAAERRWSYRGILTALRAGSYVISSYTSDVNRWFADGAKVVNLWHGVPLKRIERDIAGGPLELIYRDRGLIRAAFRDQTRPPDLLLSPSRYIAEHCFAGAFAVPLDRCLPFGYPRTDHFFERGAEPPHPLLLAEPATWDRVRGRDRVVGYFPTWRDGQIDVAAPGGLDLARFAAELDEVGAHLVFKPHFVAIAPPPVPGATTLGNLDDAHAYLPLCDVLVTDYSSLAFDFMLLDRPIVYFVPDLEEYTRYRGFYFDPLEMMPGPLVRDPGDLVAAVAAALDSGPHPSLRSVRERVWDGYAGGASARLAETLAATSTRSATS